MSKPLPENRALHYQALGHLCAVWASLDRSINRLLQELLDCPESQVACLATQMDGVGTRCTLARQLIYTKTQNEAWIADYIVTLNAITNEIGPLRNRCVHDFWEFDEQKISRVDRRAKLAKPGASTPTEISFDLRHTMTTSQIDDLITLVCTASVAILAAMADMNNHQELKELSPEKSVLMTAVHALLLPRLEAHRAGKPSQG